MTQNVGSKGWGKAPEGAALSLLLKLLLLKTGVVEARRLPLPPLRRWREEDGARWRRGGRDKNEKEGRRKRDDCFWARFLERSDENGEKWTKMAQQGKKKNFSFMSPDLGLNEVYFCKPCLLSQFSTWKMKWTKDFWQKWTDMASERKTGDCCNCFPLISN